MGRGRVCISPQLERLPAAGERPQCPRRQKKPPSELVGSGGGQKGEKKWSPDRASVPEGWLKGGGVSMPEGTLRHSDQGVMCPACVLPNHSGKSAQFSGQVLHHQKLPLCCVGPGDVGGRPGENRRGRWEGSFRTGGAGEEGRVFAPPTRAQGAYWAPRWGPLPSETRSGGHTWAPLFHRA